MAWTENDIRRRFLSDECAAFTLIFRFENRRARERSERARESPFSTGQYIPRGFYFHTQNRRSPKWLTTSFLWPQDVQHYWGHRRHKPSLNMCEMLYEHTTKTCTVKHLYQEFLFRRVTRHALPECHLPSRWQIENIYKLNFDSAVMQNLVSGTVTLSSI